MIIFIIIIIIIIIIILVERPRPHSGAPYLIGPACVSSETLASGVLPYTGYKQGYMCMCLWSSS